MTLYSMSGDETLTAHSTFVIAILRYTWFLVSLMELALEQRLCWRLDDNDNDNDNDSNTSIAAPIVEYLTWCETREEVVATIVAKALD